MYRSSVFFVSVVSISLADVYVLSEGLYFYYQLAGVVLTTVWQQWCGSNAPLLFRCLFLFPTFCCCSFCCLQLSVYWPNVKVSNVNDRCSDDDDDKAILTEGLQSHTQQPQHVHWCTQQTDFSYRHCWRVPVLYWHFSTPFNLPACQLVINKHYVSLVAFPLSFSRATAAASAVIYSDSLSLSLRFA